MLFFGDDKHKFWSFPSGLKLFLHAQLKVLSCAGSHVQSGKEERRRPLSGTLRVRQESKDVFCGCSESAGLW